LREGKRCSNGEGTATPASREQVKRPPVSVGKKGKEGRQKEREIPCGVCLYEPGEMQGKCSGKPVGRSVLFKKILGGPFPRKKKKEKVSGGKRPRWGPKRGLLPGGRGGDLRGKNEIA